MRVVVLVVLMVIVMTRSRVDSGSIGVFTKKKRHGAVGLLGLLLGLLGLLVKHRVKKCCARQLRTLGLVELIDVMNNRIITR